MARERTCGEQCVRFLVVTFNLLFLAAGVALIALGAVALANYDPWFKVVERANDDQRGVDLYGLIRHGPELGPAIVTTVGAVLTLVSFFGCCGAWKESPCLLLTYAVVVAVIALAQAAGGAWVLQGNQLEELLDPGFRKLILSYNDADTKPEVRNLIDEFQLDNECCGSSSFRDYLNATQSLPPNVTSLVPQSCCKRRKADGALAACEWTEASLLAECPIGGSDNNQCPVFEKGCLEEIKHELFFILDIAAQAVILLSFLELFCVSFACFLAGRNTKSGKQNIRWKELGYGRNGRY